MIRIFDILFVFFIGFLFLPIIILVAIIVKYTSKGPVLYWSYRFGKNNVLFKMPKFRTMLTNTPSIASDLLINPRQYITPIGSFLRKTSLDELPQLWSILKGQMSFVGPRPALFNQEDLIKLRTKYGVQTLTPGLTGWAQINGRDEISVSQKVKLDFEYLLQRSFLFNVKILWQTILRVIFGNGISH
jgi:O-antigen biosynthesis protein WbqP